jgi:predicted heme/steroid binding protein
MKKLISYLFTAFIITTGAAQIGTFKSVKVRGNIIFGGVSRTTWPTGLDSITKNPGGDSSRFWKDGTYTALKDNVTDTSAAHNFYKQAVYHASFDTSSRVLTLTALDGSTATVLIPRGTASGTSGIVTLSNSVSSDSVTISGDNGSHTTFSRQDARITSGDISNWNSKLSASDTVGKWVITITKNPGGDSFYVWKNGTHIALKDNVTDTSAAHNFYKISIYKAVFDTSSRLLTLTGLDGSTATVLIPSGTGSGITSIGTLDSDGASVNGAVIGGNIIYFQSASHTSPGFVNILTQTFAGQKTFSSSLLDSLNIVALGSVSGSYLRTTETSLLTTPPSGYGYIWSKTDGTLHYLNSTGTDIILNGYTLPIASTTVLGGVKVDGVTITISGGTISVAAFYDSSLMASKKFVKDSLAVKQHLITLTTTGTSSASTFDQETGALNIPNYGSAGATWSGHVYGTSWGSGNLTIASTAVQWTFTGSSPATWTLPTYSSLVNQFYFIKNIGSANLTVQRAGSDSLYATSKVTSFIISPGQSAVFSTASSNTANLWTILFSAQTGADVGLGNVDNTSNATERAATATITNHRWIPRIDSTTSSATPTINTNNVDIYKITAQTANITSFTTNLSGSPQDGEILEIQITGTAARAITWGADFVAGTVPLPTTTVTTATLTTIFQRYTTSSYGNNKWACVNYY